MAKEEKNDNGPLVMTVKFADSKVPVFKESRSKDYILYGEDNRYPEYLTYLFDKSPKHGAIVGGKAKYIFGKGFENGDFIINRLGESLNDIAKKAILDIEIYGGFRWEVLWNMVGKVQEVYHVDYTTLRNGKNGGFYYKQSWDRLNHDQEEYLPAFDPSDPHGSQIYAYNEYRPMVRFYPLPSYIACNNYIETDIEISKFNLSAIRNGMMPSKMIQFFKGEPTEDKKAQIERRFGSKFSGAENAGKFILVFNDANQVQQSVKIDDLSHSEMDKLFVELNKTTQQEIYSGHSVTSPVLFGIKTEGQLGGNTELYTAYAIFQNTYSKPKAEVFSKEVEFVLGYSSFLGKYDLMPSDPIGVQFDVKDVINALPKEFVFTALGIPREMWGLENIGSDNRPTPTVPIPPSTQVSNPTVDPSVTQTAASAPVNDVLKNMNPKQHAQVMRIIRDYSKGRLAAPAAKAMLRSGYGLSDQDINDLLGIVPAAMSAQEQDDYIIAMFDACGDSKKDFEIIKSRKVFSADPEEEEIFMAEAFKTIDDVTTSEKAILDLIKKDPKITPKVISQAIGETEAYVTSKIANLTKRGLLESTSEMIGEDEIVSHFIPEGADIKVPPAAGKSSPAQIFIKYSYEGPVDNRNRPFCAKMMELNRLYSRADIEKISDRLGYSVFDRRGGFYTRKGTHDTTPYCRHNWVSQITVQKKNS